MLPARKGVGDAVHAQVSHRLTKFTRRRPQRVILPRQYERGWHIGVEMGSRRKLFASAFEDIPRRGQETSSQRPPARLFPLELR